MIPLPIDPEIPAIVGAVERHGALVLVAEPGAGKTTRLPPALLAAPFAANGEVLVTAPRRLAVRMAARRVAAERGERLGDRIGYRVRFEEAASPGTRLLYLTEGILLRRLLADSRLDGVAAVVVDEFHERALEADLALALLRRLRRGPRPDLRIVVMSATLAAEPVAAFLEAPVHRVVGRPFEVAIAHAEEAGSRGDERPLEWRVAAALARLLDDPADDGGDLLVFLPGAAEIRRARDAAAALAERHALVVAPLHGDLPPAEQDLAVRPSEKRKLVLSTNVAETSVTIDGVTVVLDSGLARVAGHSPWSGLPTLATQKISRAAAAQRAGRAGRTAPGRCLRLYSRHDHDTRPAFDEAAVAREDLSGALLTLAGSGVPDARAFDWFERPREAALEAAARLLADLGATDSSGALTPTGREMLRLPLHPRAARLFVEAAARGAVRRGALTAAMLGERDVRLDARTRFDRPDRAPASPSGPSDLLAQLDAIEAGERGAAARERLRSRDQLVRLSGRRDGGLDAAAEDRILLEATLAAFPDRVARRRERDGAALVFARGGGGELAPGSVVRAAEFLVAVDADERPGRGAFVRLASEIDPAWLVDLFPGRVEERTQLVFNEEAGRVEEVSALVYEGLVLESSRRVAPCGPATADLLLSAILARGIGSVADATELARWRERLAFAAAHAPGLPPSADASIRQALADLAAGCRSLDEVREAGVVRAWLGHLTAEQRTAVEQLAPEHVLLPGGRRVTVRYEAGKPPWIASRMQDFFGMGDGPRVAGGRVALVLHLLAPSQRPVQVTTDLAGFWSRHYPTIRRELMRRYPKHAWPEDPRSASPPPVSSRRMR